MLNCNFSRLLGGTVKSIEVGGLLTLPSNLLHGRSTFSQPAIGFVSTENSRSITALVAWDVIIPCDLWHCHAKDEIVRLVVLGTLWGSKLLSSFARRHSSRRWFKL